jgi:adenosylcobinamide kinase / adenosylcobinamide-phosphate guanylyltransferase
MPFSGPAEAADPADGASARRLLVLGGARSGKSSYAERVLAGERDVVYAATAPRYEGDAEWAERIEQHRLRRPSTWRTEEVAAHPTALAELLCREGPSVLVDCLTLWLTAAMDHADAWDEEAWRSGRAASRLAEGVEGLVAAFRGSPRRVVVVSNEVGFGLVPESPGTRRFRDELGRLNQAFAQAAEAALLIVAGLPLVLKAPAGGAA